MFLPRTLQSKLTEAGTNIFISWRDDAEDRPRSVAVQIMAHDFVSWSGTYPFAHACVPKSKENWKCKCGILWETTAWAQEQNPPPCKLHWGCRAAQAVPAPTHILFIVSYWEDSRCASAVLTQTSTLTFGKTCLIGRRY